MSNLWTAASDGDIERVKHLLASDSTLTANSADENGYTCMHAAASWGHSELLRLLVSAPYNGDINISDNDGDTPLFTVESMEMCRLVLELGGDPTLVNSEGLTPARVIFEEHEDIARYIASITGEELPAVASTSSNTMDGLVESRTGYGNVPTAPPSLQDMQALLQPLSTSANGVDPAMTAQEDLASLDPISRQAAIETNERAGSLLARVQQILIQADATGEDPEPRIRAVVDEAVRGTMQAGRQMAEMQVEQEEAPSQTITATEEVSANGTPKRQRTEQEQNEADQPER